MSRGYGDECGVIGAVKRDIPMVETARGFSRPILRFQSGDGAEERTIICPKAFVRFANGCGYSAFA